MLFVETNMEWTTTEANEVEIKGFLPDVCDVWSTRRQDGQ
jgi:hypothetical protein